MSRGRIRFPPLDYPMALAAFGLVAVGLATVYSATWQPGAHEGLWIRQLVWAAAAIAFACLVGAVHPRVYDTLAYALYALSLVLLALVPVIGASAYGAQRWLDIGPLRFQPSELAKIAVVLVLARRLGGQAVDPRRFGTWFRAALVVAAPFVLVIRQPDLGTSLSFPVIGVAMLYWAGMPLRYLMLGLSPVFNVLLFLLVPSPPWWAVAAFYLAVALALASVRPRAPRWFAYAMWAVALGANVAVSWGTPRLKDHLPEYQARRIESFVRPGHDPHGAGYQIIQSRIAIGSGGWIGKGYLRGTQKGLAFLPMRHTDFIFSVVGEELGFIGAATVVLLYGLLIFRGLRLAVVTRDGFASLVAVGLVTALFYHIMVNLLMTIGAAPVTGLPLPLLSYGGTALIVNGVEIGMLQGVALRRREF